MRGLSLVVASGGHSSSRCTGLPPSRPLLLRSTGSRHAGSVIAAHGPSRSAARGILPGQGPNPCPLNWQADSQPLCHQERPQILCFLQIEVLWQPCVEQVCQFHFSNSIYSLQVSVYSHFGNSCNISNFFIIIVFVMVICGQ